MTHLKPFEKHHGDISSLESCGGELISRAAEGLTNGKLTKRSYSPAIGSVRGDCSPLIEAAESKTLHDAEDVSAELAWAAIVSRYWGTQISGFNARVEEIKQNAWEDIAGDDDDHDGEKRRIRQEARRDWWAAHEGYIEDGRTRTKAMLRDGPTPTHLRAAVEAGVMPPMEFDYSAKDAWAAFKGIFVPPNGDGVEKGIWVAKGAALLTLWAGHAQDRFAKYRYRPLPLAGSGPYLSPFSRGYAPFSFTRWAGRVPGYLNPNSWQLRYGADRYRWTRDPLTFQRQYGPETKWGTIARYTDKGFYALDFAAGAYDQWNRDTNRSDLSTNEKGARAVTRATVETAGAYVGIEAGAKLGFAIGSATGTPVGAVVGTVVGGVVGGVIGSGLAEEGADYAVEGATTAWNAAADGLDEIGDALDEADIGDKLAFW